MTPTPSKVTPSMGSGSFLLLAQVSLANLSKGRQFWTFFFPLFSAGGEGKGNDGIGRDGNSVVAHWKGWRDCYRGSSYEIRAVWKIS